MDRAPHSPHDAVFKHLLSHRATAKDFLDIHLLAPLRALCNLNTLQLESGSFIDDELRASHSDILYSLQTQAGEGYIYLLIEHQSSADRHMAFRLMRYAIAAMQRHLDKGHTAAAAGYPPAVLSWPRFALAVPDVLAGRLCRSGRCAADLW